MFVNSKSITHIFPLMSSSMEPFKGNHLNKQNPIKQSDEYGTLKIYLTMHSLASDDLNFLVKIMYNISKTAISLSNPRTSIIVSINFALLLKFLKG